MRVFSKKAYRLQRGDKQVSLKPLAFADIDEAFAKDWLFRLAVADGDIQIIADTAKQKKLEADPGKPSRGGSSKKNQKPEPTGESGGGADAPGSTPAAQESGGGSPEGDSPSGEQNG